MKTTILPPAVVPGHYWDGGIQYTNREYKFPLFVREDGRACGYFAVRCEDCDEKHAKAKLAEYLSMQPHLRAGDIEYEEQTITYPVHRWDDYEQPLMPFGSDTASDNIL